MGERDGRPIESYAESGAAAGPGQDEPSTPSPSSGASLGPIRRSDPRKVEAILFDLDNTLIDFLRVKRLASAACARALIAAGADFGEDPDAVADMLFHHYLEHGIESDDAFETFLRRYQRNKFSYSQNQVDKVLAAGLNAYLRTKDTLLAPYAGVPSTLVALVRRGYRLGVVTDAPRLKAWQRLWAVGLADFFEVVVTRTDAGREKPHGRGFQTALESLGVSPHRAAMVGDWPARDIVGGNRLGLYTVLAQYGRAGHEDLGPFPVVADRADHDDDRPDAVLHGFGDLLRLFPGAPRQPTGN